MSEFRINQCTEKYTKPTILKIGVKILLIWLCAAKEGISELPPQRVVTNRTNLKNIIKNHVL